MEGPQRKFNIIFPTIGKNQRPSNNGACCFECGSNIALKSRFETKFERLCSKCHYRNRKEPKNSVANGEDENVDSGIPEGYISVVSQDTIDNISSLVVCQKCGSAITITLQKAAISLHVPVENARQTSVSLIRGAGRLRGIFMRQF